LATVPETVAVSGQSPTVDTTSATVAVNLGEQLLQGTPGGRDIWATLEAKVPGLVMSRPDVGGTSGGLRVVASLHALARPGDRRRSIPAVAAAPCSAPPDRQL
jgi:hypothetical protein